MHPLIVLGTIKNLTSEKIKKLKMVISQIVTVKSQIVTVAPCIVVVSSVHVRLGAISKLCLLNKSQQLKYEKKNHKSDIELFNLKFSNSKMFLSPFSSRNNSICQQTLDSGRNSF